MIITINKEDELFKPIKYVGIQKNRYLISNYGEVIDLKTNKRKKLSPHKGNGYVVGKFKMENGKKKTLAIHRLVAFTFVDGYDDLEEKIIVNHKDSIKDHNYYENLEWVTTSENNFHKYEHGKGDSKPPTYLGEEHPQNIYEITVIIQICQLIEKGLSNTNIMKTFGYAGQNDNKKFYSLIYDIRRKRTWTHVSENFNF
jgi:hypothetical protein